MLHCNIITSFLYSTFQFYFPLKEIFALPFSTIISMNFSMVIIRLNHKKIITDRKIQRVNSPAFIWNETWMDWKSGRERESSWTPSKFLKIGSFLQSSRRFEFFLEVGKHPTWHMQLRAATQAFICAICRWESINKGTLQISGQVLCEHYYLHSVFGEHC